MVLKHHTALLGEKVGGEKVSGGMYDNALKNELMWSKSYVTWTHHSLKVCKSRVPRIKFIPIATLFG